MCYSSGTSGKLMIQKGPSCHCLYFDSLWIPRSAHLHQEFSDLSWPPVTGDFHCTKSYVLQFPNGYKKEQ